MQISSDPLIYRGMTANQLAQAYDDTLSIPNLYTLLSENREKASIIREKLNPLSDIAYGRESIQKLDIYKPEHAEKLPVLIDIHGGGWAAGSKNARSIPAEAIISQGILWMTLDYGLAPQYQLGEIIKHIRVALAWIYKNIAHYGGDPEKIYISGQSAGAHLAATTIMPGWHKDFDVPEDLIKGLIALSGLYDLVCLIHAAKNETQDILQLNAEKARLYSPYHHLPKIKIPSIIAYGEKEPLAYFREASDYAKALKSCGSEVSLIEVPDANHFDMINALSDKKSRLFEMVMNMINV